MRFRLALASLARHPTRTLLALLGVAVAGALLLDMVMLSSGMRQSFGALLDSRGFQLRLAPRGTMPFDTEAGIRGAAAIAATLRERPDVRAVSPVLGGQLHVTAGRRAFTSFALGVEPEVQGDYERLTGGDAALPDRVVVNDAFLRGAGARVGDTVAAATGYDAQMRTFAGERRLVITGRARFLYLPAGQPAAALPLATLQRMRGGEGRDVVSLFMVRVRPGANPDSVARAIDASVPAVDAISTAEALERVDRRLAYFRQLGAILGSVSFAVALLLVTTLVTVSVGERLGEIAVLRAIGVARSHVVQQVMLETGALTMGGAVLGLGLGLVAAHYLDAILRTFPGLPAAIHFFPFQPRAAGVALGLLALAGVAAAIAPAWRAAVLPLGDTLREEAVA